MQYNPSEYDEILNIFKSESDEIIQGFNDEFLKLEKNSKDKAPIKKLLQLAHSLKGSARMLGFKSVEEISHKTEDILACWNKNDIDINLKNIQFLYDVIDYLAELITKIVQIKADIYDSKTIDFIHKLEDINIQNCMIPVEQIIKSKKTKEANFIDINAIILELIFIFEMGWEDKNEILTVVAENIAKLAELFEDTEYEEIKDTIKKINTLVNSDKASMYDLNFYKTKISELKDNIYALNKNHSKGNDINIASKKNVKEKEILPPIAVDDINIKFDFIIQNFNRVKVEKSFLNVINDNLEQICLNVNIENASNILSKIINIIEKCLKDNVMFDNDGYLTIFKGISLAKRIYNGENNFGTTESIIDRLNVVEDMIGHNTGLKEITPVNEVKIISKDKYKQFNKNVTPFDIQEIKTLRVDIEKLDNLIAQTGELLINGIKNREHVSGLYKISSELSKWNSESKKIMNYIRYYEKKGFFNSENADIANIFFKKIQTFFTENVNVITDLNNEFVGLYNTIFEDDNKLNQTVLEIETIAKSIRVLPLATIFHSFPRMIRDIAKEYNKQVDFYVSGSDTTVDKKIIEEIKMPLIHILRNAVSHGIETSEDRIKNNKQETGIIRLSAKQAENNVIIIIEDDGYGININKIKEIALNKGILTEDEIENMTNEQIMKLIFLPGFSTKDTVTDIAGRGVGLDVVKTKIANLNGDITVDSVINKGCKITIKVPLSMSTLKTFLLLVDGQKYVIPVNSIKFVKMVKKEEIIEINGSDCIIYDNHSIPVFYLSEILNEKPHNKQEDIINVIILENQGIQAAFAVDKLIGSMEVFQKKLVPPIIKIKNISGFTTLSTGEICLIINPYELIKNAVKSDIITSTVIKQII